LNTMVDDMLDISKLEAGLLNAWRKDGSLRDIVDDLQPSLVRKAAVKGVELEIDVDPDLPEVYCDDEKVSRVLINLTVNAIKFCQANGHVRIWARHDPDSREMTIGVTDNGPGIDEEGIARIFTRFQQVHGNIRGSCKGFGLGLNIAKELVDLNFGSMSVESQPGEGSTFTFTLPLADPMEVMRRYLKRLEHLRNGSTKVSLINVQLSDWKEESSTEDINAYLHYVLQRNDLVFRVSDDRWLLVLPINEMELDKFFEKAEKTRKDINRNRVRGPLPNLEMEAIGTWHVKTKRHEVFHQLRVAVGESDDPAECTIESASRAYAHAAE